MRVSSCSRCCKFIAGTDIYEHLNEDICIVCRDIAEMEEDNLATVTCTTCGETHRAYNIWNGVCAGCTKAEWVANKGRACSVCVDPNGADIYDGGNYYCWSCFAQEQDKCQVITIDQ